MFIVDECFYKKREYLLLAGAYAIMALAKKDIVPWVHKAKAPEVATLGLSLSWLSLSSPSNHLQR